MVDRVGDGPGRAGQHPEQHVPVEQPERPGHLVLLLEHQPVQAPPGDLVQRVPGVEDLLVRGADLGTWRGRHPGGRHRLDRVHVPQPAPGLLQVGLEQEGELAAGPGPLVVRGVQLGQARGCRGPPVLQGTRPQSFGEIGVTGHVPGGQQPERDLQVGPGHPPGLRDGAHRVVEFGPGVPDRVPDAVRDARDVVPAAVQQQHVQVAARQHLAPSVPADRHQGHVGLGAEESGQPPVHLGGPAGPIRGERCHGFHARPPARSMSKPVRWRPARAPRCGL